MPGPLVRAVLVGLVLGLVGCGATPEPRGSERCPVATLPEGAVVRFAGGGGFGGASFSFVAFATGRVDATDNRAGTNESFTVEMGKPRVDRLVNELRATELTDEDEGCYLPDRGEEESDGVGSGITMRDGDAVRGWSYSSGGDAPDEVDRALDVASAFLDEVRGRK